MKKIDGGAKALIVVLLAAIFGGGNAVFTKIGLQEISLFSFNLIRFSLAIVFLSPFFIKDRIRFDRNTYKLLFISLLATANVLVFSYGVRMTAASVAQMIHTATPLAIAVFSYILYGERVTKNKAWGIFIGLAGVWIIILSPIINGRELSGVTLKGNLFIAASVIAFSLYSVYLRKVQKHYTSIQIIVFFCLTTIIASLPFAYQEHLASNNWIYNLSPISIISLLYTALIGGFLFYTFYQYAIKHTTAVVASSVMYLVPVVAFGWAMLLLGERLSAGFIIGAVLTIAGAYMVTRKQKEALMPPAE